MKRLLYVLSAAVILMAIASGCGEKNREKSAETQIIEDIILYYGCSG